MAMMAMMMLMMMMEHWSWRGLWILPSKVVWTLETALPSTVGPQPSHPPHGRGGPIMICFTFRMLFHTFFI